MSTKTIEAVNPADWRRGRGYSHAIRSNGRLSVAGLLPWDPVTQQIGEEDFAGQWRQALTNLRTVVEAGGGQVDTITALRIYVTDLDAYRAAGRALGEAWTETLGGHFPAITLVEVSRLVEDGALLEVEAEAVVAEAQ